MGSEMCIRDSVYEGWDTRLSLQCVQRRAAVTVVNGMLLCIVAIVGGAVTILNKVLQVTLGRLGVLNGAFVCFVSAG